MVLVSLLRTVVCFRMRARKWSGLIPLATRTQIEAALSPEYQVVAKCVEGIPYVLE